LMEKGHKRKYAAAGAGLLALVLLLSVGMAEETDLLGRSENQDTEEGVTESEDEGIGTDDVNEDEGSWFGIGTADAEEEASEGEEDEGEDKGDETVSVDMGPFLNEDDQPVADANVSLYYGDEEYTSTTNRDGMASLDIPADEWDGSKDVKGSIEKGNESYEFSGEVNDDGEFSSESDLPKLKYAEGNFFTTTTIVLIGAAALAILTILVLVRRRGGSK